MYKVWDGTEWSSAKALKVWNGTSWKAGLKFKVRTSTSWLPGSVSDKDDSQIVKWSVEAPTPPPPPPPVTHPVPNLNLKTLAEVNSLLEPLSFTYSVTGYEITSDNTKDDKVVIDSQYPAAGQSLAEGNNVTFKLYNFVQPTTTVPNIDNLLVSAANTAITNANLVVSTNIGTDETYDTNLIGRVINGSQYPAAGSTVDTGTEVTYDRWVQKPFATVPDLVGDDESTVFQQLSTANLNPGTRTAFATTVASLNNKVKSQFPAAGTQVQQDTSVNYTVNEHTLTVVPNLAGLTPAAANLLLQQNYLYPRTTTPEETTNTSLENKVKSGSQVPAAGTTVAKDSYVDYVYYVPNTTTTVPNVIGQQSTTAFSNMTAAELVGVDRTTFTRTSSNFNKVYQTNPIAGTPMNVGSQVEIYYYIEETKWVVPDIRGNTPGTNGTQIANYNFTWGSKTLSDTPTESTSLFGKIATQSPTQGTLAYSDPINYGLYVDGRPTMPNIVGMTEADAKIAINNAGLNWNTPTTQAVSSSSLNYLAGTVASQGTASGTRLSSGTYVSFVVYTAYVAQPVTRTGYVYIGYQGDIAMQWQASYRDTLGTVAATTDGGRLTTTAPYYFGQFSTTSSNGKQHHAFQFDWTSFDNRCKVVSGGAAYTITNVELRYWLNDGVGNTNAKSLRVGSYTSMVSSSPTTMTEANINTRGLTLSASTRGTYAFATLNTTLKNDIFTFPNYPTVVYAPNTSPDNYGSNDGDVRYTVTIQWTELV